MGLLIIPLVIAVVLAVFTSFLSIFYLKARRDNFALFIFCFGIIYSSVLPFLIAVGSMEQQRSNGYNAPIVIEKLVVLKDKTTGIQNGPY